MNDRILTAYLNDFVDEHGFGDMEESTAFEHFTSYLIVGRYSPDQFEPDEVAIGGSGDLGLDGVGFIVNDHLIHSTQDADYFKDELHRLDVRFIFVQAKTSPKFDGADIGTFISGVRQFFGSTLSTANERVLAFHDIKEHIYDCSIDMDESPICTLYYVTTGSWQDDQALLNRIHQGKQDLLSTNLFSDVEFIPLGSNGLRALHQETNQRVARQIRFDKYTILPDIPGVEEAYIGILPCSEYLKLICDDEGNLNRRLFYDNVRDFQGRNAVNQEIEDTIQDSEQSGRFALLNNGVTIVAGDLTTVGVNFRLRDYQIVNGCQTSHIIYFNKDRITDNTFIPLKIIVTRDGDIINQIIQGTNRQTEVKLEAFESLVPFQKQLEELYLSMGRRKGDPIYYERRSKQYDPLNIRKDRIITFPTQIQSFVAMFLDEPHSIHRYYGELLKSYRTRLFSESHKSIPYYVAGLSLCTVERLFARGDLATDVKPLKYQVLMAFRLLNEPFALPPINTNRIEQYCQGLLDVLDDDSRCAAEFQKAGAMVRDCWNVVPQGRERKERTRVLTDAVVNAAAQQDYVPTGDSVVTRVRGQVEQFSNTLGWGYIIGADDVRYFVHYTKITGTGFRSLSAAQRVEFTPLETERGPQAIEVSEVN